MNTTITLSLDQILALHIELVGHDKIKGILSYPGSFKLKYHLTQLKNELVPHVKFIEEQNNELVKQYGELNEETQQYIIKTKLADGTDNPNLKEYIQKMTELGELTKEITYPTISIDDFNGIELDGYYQHIFLILKQH